MTGDSNGNKTIYGSYSGNAGSSYYDESTGTNTHVTGPTGRVRVYGEESNELPNGSRVQFTWDAAWVADTECIYVDGVRQIRGASRSYLATPASAKIDFNSSDDAPRAGSVVTADYDVA